MTQPHLKELTIPMSDTNLTCQDQRCRTLVVLPRITKYVVRILSPEALNSMITGENKTNLESVAGSQAVSSRDAPDQQAEGLVGVEDNLESSDMNFECSAIIRNPNQNNKIIVNCDGLTDTEEKMLRLRNILRRLRMDNGCATFVRKL